MKQGLLRYDPKDGRRKNMGDYIQSLAAKQFLTQEPILVEREELNQYQGDPIKLVMNAWWMHKPENWPPSAHIKPLFTSFHITPRVASTMLSEKSIEYFKTHQPIGCRDKGTQKLLEKHGIQSYLSGCLTLTLGRSYQHTPQPNKAIIINPQFTRPSLSKPQNYLTALSRYLANFRVIKRISKKLYGADDLTSMLKTTYFYHAYSKKFDDEILINAEYISHTAEVSQFSSEQERFDYADTLLKTYSNAELVITSRLHAALPCIAIGIPTIFVYAQDIPRSAGRFDGLLEHVNCIQFNGKVWEGLGDCELPRKIAFGSKIKNKQTHQKLAEDMTDKVMAFINEKE